MIKNNKILSSIKKGLKGKSNKYLSKKKNKDKISGS